MIGQKQYTFKIVTTGPESSGKTVLAQALASYFNTDWAPEFSRYYLAHLGRAYKKEDLQTIGRGQKTWENWYAQKQVPFIICDTDWTVLQVWEEYRFGSSTAAEAYWKMGYVDPQPAQLYLLCAPDFPWQPDPLRENPAERDLLFQYYFELLTTLQVPFLIVKGSEQQRLADAVSEINKLFGPL